MESLEYRPVHCLNLEHAFDRLYPYQVAYFLHIVSLAIPKFDSFNVTDFLDFKITHSDFICLTKTLF